jgi:hypothetical protein
MSHPPIPDFNLFVKGLTGAWFFKIIDLHGALIDTVQIDAPMRQHIRQIIAAVAEVAWRKEAERRHEAIGLDFENYHKDFMEWHTAVQNAQQWRKWGEQK